MQLNHLIQKQNARWRWAFIGASILLLLICLFSLAVGEIWIIPWSPESDLAKQLLLELRLPRLIAAISIGAALAVSGAVLQVLLANPLAEPGVLGISGEQVWL